jgi:acetyl esterase/lipase
MLDDRMVALSSKQYLDEGTWTGRHNIAAWDMVLLGKRGSNNVSIYNAPARAAYLSGLPPAFIDVSDAELFRDEDVAYASKLWAAGVHAELHVYPGGWHAFDGFAPSAAISKSCLAATMTWLKRIMNTPSAAPKMALAML